MQLSYKHTRQYRILSYLCTATGARCISMHRVCCAHMSAAMYYILEWMLASSIPHVDGACLWLPYFDINLYICLYDCCVCQFTSLKRYLFIIYFLCSWPPRPYKESAVHLNQCWPDTKERVEFSSKPQFYISEDRFNLLHWTPRWWPRKFLRPSFHFTHYDGETNLPTELNRWKMGGDGGWRKRHNPRIQ